MVHQTGTPVEINVWRHGPGLGVRLDRITYMGEQIEGTPLTNSLLYCLEDQLGGVPVDGSRTFSEDGNGFTRSLDINVSNSVAENKVTFAIDATNENEFSTSGCVSIWGLLVIDVVNPRPSFKPRWKISWNQVGDTESNLNQVYIGCASRTVYPIMGELVGHWISDSSTQDYGLLVPPINKGGLGPAFVYSG